MNVTIPDNVTRIGKKAFMQCTELSSITIGNSVTSIGNSAFYDCRGLTSITLFPTIPPTLGDMAFMRVPSTAVITVPKGTLDTYKAASNWSSYKNQMVEATE